jgi:predicted DCC family thiol-disulfide oxidoreductase YuxK
MSKQIVLFDGVCHMCNRLVQFVLRHDRRGTIYFAALQSPAGQKLLAQHQLSAIAQDTFVWIEGERSYTKSTAALKTLRALGSVWQLFYILMIIPGPIRDLFYQFIAKRRYRWFGQADQCMLPKPEYQQRFLNSEKDVDG